MSVHTMLTPIYIFISILLIISTLPLPPPSNAWQSLSIGLLELAKAPPIPTHIHDSLADAIHNLNKIIDIRLVERSNRLARIRTDQLLKCIGTNYNGTGPGRVESFFPHHSIHTLSFKVYGVDLSEIGNFIMAVNVNPPICHQHPQLMAAAEPCTPTTNDHSSLLLRPLFGRLIICPHNWGTELSGSARAGVDLFRREVLHALGFGLLLSPSPSTTDVPSKKYNWQLNGGRRVKHIAHFMDFAKRAELKAMKHFACSDMDGIEAEDDKKTTLNEYIYGNELMTTIINDGPNYFTHLSATILEDTHFGNLSWYRTNSQFIELESSQYWYGRGAGCAFLTSSCFELIEQYAQERMKVGKQEDERWKNLESMFEAAAAKDGQHQSEYRSAGDDDSFGKRRKRPIFPLCDETDLFFEISLSAPKHLCLSNGTHDSHHPVHCNLISGGDGESGAITLESQFPDISSVLNKRLYGSDHSHRYCPMIKEVMAGNLNKEVPLNAYAVECDVGIGDE